MVAKLAGCVSQPGQRSISRRGWQVASSATSWNRFFLAPEPLVTVGAKPRPRAADGKSSYEPACSDRRCRRSRGDRSSHPPAGWSGGTSPGLDSVPPATRHARSPTQRAKTHAPQEPQHNGQTDPQVDVHSRNWSDRPRPVLRRSPMGIAVGRSVLTCVARRGEHGEKLRSQLDIVSWHRPDRPASLLLRSTAG